jgi:alpha-tubulin suppressor-like RCC1 family protein
MLNPRRFRHNRKLLSANIITPVTFGANKIAVGTTHGLAVINNNVYAWGEGGLTGTYKTVPTGLQSALTTKTPISVAAGDSVSVVLFSDGTVYTWTTSSTTNFTSTWTDITQICCSFGDGIGTHVYGLKSDGTVISYNPYSISGTTWNVPAGLSNVIKLSKGLRHMVALKSDGTIVNWGPTATLVSTSLYWQNFSIFTNIKDIFAGAYCTYGITNNNQIIKTGFNFTWRHQTNSPNLSNIRKMSFGYIHGIALREDKTVILWGDNFHNQRDLPSSFINSNVVDVAANAYTTYILKENGKIYGLGHDKHAQIASIPTELVDNSYIPYVDDLGTLTVSDSSAGTASSGVDAPNIIILYDSSAAASSGDPYYTTVLSFDGMRLSRGAQMSGKINKIYTRNDGKYLIVGDFITNDASTTPKALWGTSVINTPTSNPTNSTTTNPIFNSAACGGLSVRWYGTTTASQDRGPSIRVAYILNTTEVADSTNANYFFLGGNFNTILSGGVRSQYSKIAVFTNTGALPTSGEFFTFNNFIKNSGGFYSYSNYTNTINGVQSADDTTLINDIKVFITSTGEKRVIVGGQFVYYKSSPSMCRGICALRFNGTAFNSSLTDGFMGSLNGDVNNIVIDNNSKKIYAGGTFTIHSRSTTNTSTPYIVKYNENGTLDTAFLTNLGTGFNGEVTSMTLLPENRIVIVGAFTSFKGSTANRIICLNENGTLYSLFNLNLGSGANNTISEVQYSSALQKIYLSGRFTSFNNQPAHYVIRLNLDGSIDKKFVTYIDDPSAPSVTTSTRGGGYRADRFYYDNELDFTTGLPTNARSILEVY